MPLDCLPEVVPPAALVLDRAADLVERGWCRGGEVRLSLFSDKRLHCVVGALRQAAADLGLSTDFRFRDAVQAAQAVATERGYERLDLWNDAQWFRRPVVAGLREARDRVIVAAHRLARPPGDSDARGRGDLGADRREVVVA